MVALVKRINGASKLIDGAGRTGGVQAALTALAGAGIEIGITEFDIQGASPNDYTTVTKACLAVSACVAITSWGISDVRHSLLLDSNYKPKAAYNAVIAAL
ncbi:glycoside hydrolase superfamily [Crucibulum laeve]|uniref:Glycoside hydrolase superfamily n=1 Tax=Crucibulum laeve TaxID=68775 RepID=A0A5C3MP96_9AGAR|nr:glycoside hydrolase superfamily [Crucibulum laeve]